MSPSTEATPAQREFFATARDVGDAVVVNDRVVIRANGEHRVVVVDGLPFHHFAAGDRMAEAYAMVTLVECDYADQNDVARAFGRTARSVRRYQERYDRGGLESLARVGGRPTGSRPRSKSAGVRGRAVLGLKAEGHSNREIAKRLGISETAVRKRLKQQRWIEPDDQVRLFADAEPAGPSPPQQAPSVVPLSLGEVAPTTDPLDRSTDRAFAHLGLLDDAEPIFAPAASVPRAGVLLAIPGLVRSGVVEIARAVYGARVLAPAFYGLRTTMVALVLLALLRIKRPEALKEHAPVELGRLLGLDRVFEVKTLRRKLTLLACAGKAIEFGHELARRRVAERGRMLGFLYVDGHVRVYHGKHKIPKAHVPQMRLAVPGTTDYYVNDKHGDPLFVVTAEANAGMVKMLLKLAPDIRALVGKRRRPTIVFDRGGWSPKLFAQLIVRDFDVLTYRKGRIEEIPKHRFRIHRAKIDGREVEYRLHDKRVPLLKGNLRLRQVTRLCNDRHQTSILTSRLDLKAAEVAYRMFERWRQENFFKYMRDEFEIDALAEYAVEPDDPTRSVPNPARRDLDTQIKAARAEEAKLAQQYGRSALNNPEAQRPTARGFKIAHGKTGKAMRDATERVAALRQKRAALPERVPVAEALGGAPVVKLAAERKHLTTVVKMVAYQIESDLVELLRNDYARVEQEGRTLVQTALRAAGALAPGDDRLAVTLAPLSSAHRSRAVAIICDALNATGTAFPGCGKVMHYAAALTHESGQIGDG
jgi:transposase